MARRKNHRGRPKKRLNRYDPNNPSYDAVHRGVLSEPAPASPMPYMPAGRLTQFGRLMRLAG